MTTKPPRDHEEEATTKKKQPKKADHKDPKTQRKQMHVSVAILCVFVPLLLIILFFLFVVPFLPSWFLGVLVV